MSDISITRQGDHLEVTLNRQGAILVGLEVDPYPEKFRPIRLTGQRAEVAIQAILRWYEFRAAAGVLESGMPSSG